MRRRGSIPARPARRRVRSRVRRILSVDATRGVFRVNGLALCGDTGPVANLDINDPDTRQHEVMSDDQSGWFSYSPLDPSSLERLNDEQRAPLIRRRHQQAGDAPNVGEVHLFFHSLEPGQVEIRFSGPPTAAPTDILRAAIRELETAISVLAD